MCGTVQFEFTFCAKHRILVQQAGAGLHQEHPLHGLFESLFRNTSFSEQFRKVAVACRRTEFHVIACRNGVHRTLLEILFRPVERALLNGAIVTDDRSGIFKIIPEYHVDEGVAADGVVVAELVV